MTEPTTTTETSRRRPRRRRGRAELERQLEDLRRQVENLARSLGEEVRTHRLVIEGPDGFERVVAEAGQDWARVDVRSKVVDCGRTTYAGLFAQEQNADEEAGFAVAGGGSIEAIFGLRRVEDTDEPEIADDLRSRYRVDLTINDPGGRPAILIDHEGVKAHPMRLYREQQSRLEADRKATAARRARGGS